MGPDFDLCEELANELLLCQPSFHSRVDVCSLDCGQPIIYDTMQNYCEQTGAEFNDLTLDGKTGDGMYIIYGVNVLIFHNPNFVDGHVNWTLAHELGHFILGHTKHGDMEELEANMFSGKVLAPDIVIHELMARGVGVTEKYLSKNFGLSNRGAASRITTIKRRMSTNYGCRKIADDKTQRKVLKQFIPYLEKIAPKPLTFDQIINVPPIISASHF